MSASHFSGPVVSAGGLQTSSDAVVTRVIKGTVSVDPASLAAGAEEDVAVTLTGAVVGDALVLNPPAAGLTAGIEICGCQVSAANTVKIRLRNNTAGAIDEPSGVWTYLLIRS